MSGRRIYVDCYSKYYRAALTEDGKLIELILQDKEDKAQVGDIYVGRVEKILPSNIGFINIGEDKPVFLQMDNKNIVKNNQEVVIQIIKEAFDEKCAVATLNISRAGKYCVIVRDNGEIGISKKITYTVARERLKKIAEKNYREGYSIVLRTNSENASDDIIEKEIKAINEEFIEIEKKGLYTKAPAIIYKEVNPLNRAIRDLYGDRCTIVINDKEEFEKLEVVHNQIEVYEGDIPIFMNFGIESQIEKLFHRKIWLDCGGYIVIDETEAMTVVDVNSGKSIRAKDGLSINKEAAREIARQIRLRNINGMIIIDFINMKGKAQNEELYAILKEEILKDRVKTNIVGMTELGLMQLTRQKSRKPLSKYLYHKCPMCDGLGLVKDISYIAEGINSQIINIVSGGVYKRIEIEASEKILKAIEESVDIICKKFNCEIYMNKIQTSRFDYYKIDKRIK